MYLKQEGDVHEGHCRLYKSRSCQEAFIQIKVRITWAVSHSTASYLHLELKVYQSLVLIPPRSSILQHACLLQSSNERVLVTAKAKQQFFEPYLREKLLFFIVWSSDTSAELPFAGDEPASSLNELANKITPSYTSSMSQFCVLAFYLWLPLLWLSQERPRVTLAFVIGMLIHTVVVALAIRILMKYSLSYSWHLPTSVVWTTPCSRKGVFQRHFLNPSPRQYCVTATRVGTVMRWSNRFRK